MKMQRSVLLVLAVLMQFGCASATRQIVLDGQSMGTTWTVRLVVDDALARTPWAELIQNELDAVDGQMSHWDSGSALSRFNRAEPGTRHVLTPDLTRVLDYMLALSAESEGAFDPTVGALVNLWGFGPRGARVQPPDAKEVQAALQVTGWRQLQFDADAHSVLQPGGVELDLSSAAPGFAVDRVAAVFAQRGLRNYLLEFGGELRAAGRREDGSAWRVSIQRPAEAAGVAPDDVEPDDVLALNDMAMGASGDYEHYFEFEGQRYPHTLDARSGYPVRHGLAAVHVLAPQCLHADALASLLSVLGPDVGRRYALAHDVAARFVSRTPSGFELYETPAFTALRPAVP